MVLECILPFNIANYGYSVIMIIKMSCLLTSEDVSIFYGKITLRKECFNLLASLLLLPPHTYDMKVFISEYGFIKYCNVLSTIFWTVLFKTFVSVKYHL